MNALAVPPAAGTVVPTPRLRVTGAPPQPWWRSTATRTRCAAVMADPRPLPGSRVMDTFADTLWNEFAVETDEHLQAVEPILVREKQKIAGIWLNADSIDFRSAPSFYAVATTGPTTPFQLDGSASSADEGHVITGYTWTHLPPA